MMDPMKDFRLGTIPDAPQPEAIAKLELLRDSFYNVAVSIGVHAFIEHAGIMNEHIALLRRAREAGVEPYATNKHCGSSGVEMASHQATYIAEKFACIFGPFLSRETWNAFQRTVEAELNLK